MKTHNLVQGSIEWLAHRRQYFNASDAPAMMGLSSYKTRNELLHELHTGMTPSVDAATQRRFEDGHRFEALARPLAEKIIGQDLYPVVGTIVNLSASFDGLTIDESVAWEHKTMNAELYKNGEPWGDDFVIPLHYRIQMEQQCMVSGCTTVLFTASRWGSNNTIACVAHRWYISDPDLRANIIAGWEQLAADLALYIPPVVAPVLVAAAQKTLPAVSVKLDGAIAVIDNLGVFGVALTDYIGKINKSPQTDQDFVDLKAVVTTLEKAETALDAAEQAALASIASVNAMQSAIGTLRTLTKTNRLLCDKIYKAENERRKLEIIQGGKDAAAAYIDGLDKRLGRPYMPAITSDFAGAAKGLRTLASMQNAVDTELARFKIEASATADRLQANLTVLRETAKDHAFLFADTPQIVLKANDDFRVLVDSRIAAHKAEELRKEEAQRERIRIEELARIEREQAAALAAEEKKAAALASIVKPAIEIIATAVISPAQVATTAPAVNVASVAVSRPTAPPTLRLVDINALLSPITLSADGLDSLNLMHSGIDKGAKLYRVSDVAHICTALVAHIQTIFK